MTGYPPKCPQNGRIHHVGARKPTGEHWVGDTWERRRGVVYTWNGRAWAFMG